LAESQLILVIEDDRDIRDSITEVLENEGYRVDAVENGKLGLDYLLKEGAVLPSAILLDLMMPVMTGMEFRKAQLAEPRISQIPLIVMSADNRATQKAKEMATAICILKPLEIDELLVSLKKLGV
jgi:CheY-like chemotaxis protein